MRISIISALLITLLTSAPLLASERPDIPPKLTLQRAVEISFAHSPVLRLADSQLRQTEAARDRARSSRLPQLSIGAFEALQTLNLEARGIQAPPIPGIGSLLPIRVGPFSQVDARSLITQEVVNLSLRHRHRAGNARVEGAQAGHKHARELLALNVVVGYVQALRNQAAEATLRQQLSFARQLYTITEDRFQQGVASSLDVKRSLQQVNNLQQSLYERENALLASKLALANVIHARISADYELADIGRFYDTRSTSKAETISLALRSRPDYQAAQLQVRAAELELRSAQSRRYPTLSFAADYGQSGRRPFNNLNTYRIQGSLNIPVYLGGGISAEIKESRGRLEEARALRDQIMSQVETEVLTALEAVRSARRQVEVAEDTIRLASEEIDLTTARFTSGVTDNTEVVNAQDRLARAEENRIRALFNLNIARANLHRATGAAEATYH